MDMDPTINTHLIPYPGLLRTASWWEVSFKVLCYVVLVVVALAGNIIVVRTVYGNKGRMRATTYYYLVNLAVCDIVITVFCTWVHLVADLNEGWVLGAFFCKFSSFIQVLSLVSSILTLTLIACDRFFGIVFAMRAHLTTRRPAAFIALVWLASGTIAAPLLFYRSQLTRIWLNHTEVWCTDTWPHVEYLDLGTNSTAVYSSLRTLYYTLVSLMLYFMPALVMFLAYAVIVGKLWSHRTPGEGVETEVAAQLTVKRKVIKMLSILLTVFVLCWMPSQISILYAEYRTAKHLALPKWYSSLQYASTFLAYTNSALNPIIYTCFNDNFRKGFRDCICCKRQSSTTLSRSRCQRERNSRGRLRWTPETAQQPPLTTRTLNANKGCLRHMDAWTVDIDQGHD